MWYTPVRFSFTSALGRTLRPFEGSTVLRTTVSGAEHCAIRITRNSFHTRSGNPIRKPSDQDLLPDFTHSGQKFSCSHIHTATPSATAYSKLSTRPDPLIASVDEKSFRPQATPSHTARATVDLRFDRLSQSQT